jgi:hypothetical protein
VSTAGAVKYICPIEDRAVIVVVDNDRHIALFSSDDASQLSILGEFQKGEITALWTSQGKV